MKELDDLRFPADMRYSDDHEWARQVGEHLRIGISDYAQDRLGDITYVELPEMGDLFTQGDEFGTVESTKAASEMLIPVGGEVVAINKALEDSPGLINQDPYDKGWIIEIKITNIMEFDELMSKEDYLIMLKGTE
jgi:glycine cleavage system H protein